jgi:uncharacterized protein YutE (UPF0331/DUF86 family)
LSSIIAGASEQIVEWDYRFSAERLAQLVIQYLLDLAAMLAVREAGKKPDTYRELSLWFSRKLSLYDESAKFLVGLAGSGSSSSTAMLASMNLGHIVL